MIDMKKVTRKDFMALTSPASTANLQVVIADKSIWEYNPKTKKWTEIGKAK